MADVPSLLITTLDDMLEKDLERFTFWLSKDVPEGFKPIGRGRLEKKSVIDIMELMVKVYGEKDVVMVALHALRKAEQNDLAQRLEEDHKRSRLCSPDMRVVLIGKTGAGKSASGNTILGRRAFKSEFSPSSVTRSSERSHQEIAGRSITVIDTPGIFDTSMPEEQVKQEIEKCIALSVPGPHAFLLVVRLGRFMQEERNAVRWIQDRFGEEASRYTMVLFTGGDQLDKSVQEFLSDSHDLQEVISSCGGGYHVFNNKDGDGCSQVSELMRKMDEMVERNGGQHYTNEMFQEAERRIREEEERRRKEEEEKKRQEEERIREEEERRRKEEEEKNRQEEERIRAEEKSKRVAIMEEEMNNFMETKFMREVKRAIDNAHNFFG